jgi:hypothetical protein
MSTQPHPSHLAWLDRMAARVPGYGGYDRHERRLAAAHALRDALATPLLRLKAQLQQARADCQRREAHTEIPAVERVELHLERILHRLSGFGTVEAFYNAPDLKPGQVDPLYAADHAALDTAERLTHYFDTSDPSHNRLAAIEAGLKSLEQILDERAMLLRTSREVTPRLGSR